jgi:hypothetical protein
LMSPYDNNAVSRTTRKRRSIDDRKRVLKLRKTTTHSGMKGFKAGSQVYAEGVDVDFSAERGEGERPLDSEDGSISRKLREVIRKTLSLRKDDDEKIISTARAQAREVILDYTRKRTLRQKRLMNTANDLKTCQIVKMRKELLEYRSCIQQWLKKLEKLRVAHENTIFQANDQLKSSSDDLKNVEDDAKSIREKFIQSLHQAKRDALGRISRVSKADTLMKGISNLLGTMM